MKPSLQYYSPYSNNVSAGLLLLHLHTTQLGSLVVTRLVVFSGRVGRRVQWVSGCLVVYSVVVYISYTCLTIGSLVVTRLVVLQWQGRGALGGCYSVVVY